MFKTNYVLAVVLILSCVVAGFFAQQQHVRPKREVLIKPQKLSGTSKTVTEVVSTSSPEKTVVPSKQIQQVDKADDLQTLANAIASQTDFSTDEIQRVLQGLPKRFEIFSLPEELLTALVEQHLERSPSPASEFPPPTNDTYDNLLDQLQRQHDSEDEYLREERIDQSLKAYLLETGSTVSTLHGSPK